MGSALQPRSGGPADAERPRARCLEIILNVVSYIYALPHAARMSEVVPLFTAAVSGLFAALLILQFREKRKPAQALWAAGFLLFVVASVIEAAAEAGSWSALAYRSYFVITAVMVGLLGAGTALLLGDRRIGLAALAYVVIAGVILAILAFTDSVNEAALAAARANGVLPTGRDVFGSVLTRIFHPVIDVPGAALLIGGAAYSWHKTKAAYNLLIGIGAVVFTVNGFLPSGGQTGVELLNAANVFFLGNLAGLLIMFAGFLKSREVPAPRQALAPVPA